MKKPGRKTQRKSPLPPLLITSGDPAGIGPEVTHKALKALGEAGEVLPHRPVVVIGDAFLYVQHLSRAREMHLYHLLPLEDFAATPEDLLEDLAPERGEAWRPIFLDCGVREEAHIALGKAQKKAGERALYYLEAALDLMADGLTDAICTGPIHKAAAARAGFAYPGQTELFGDFCDVRRPVMMLTGGGLRVALVTIHEPLAKVPKLVTTRRVARVIEVTAAALVRDFGLRNPRIAVCGLNPHAGEDGRFGDEERKSILPAVRSSRKKSAARVEGPLAADSAFALARRGEYDAVVAMYHDQGLTAVKTLAFDEGVNLTLGLPLVRTAPDHGTAFDLAGCRKACAGAMLEAIRSAHEISVRRAGKRSTR